MTKGTVRVDLELAEIGQKLLQLNEQKRQIEREIHEWETRQSTRLKLIAGLDHVHNFPTKDQAQLITTFKLAMSQSNPILLTVAFNLCTQTGADKTNWRTEHGESVAVAYQRRLAELESK